MFGKTRCGFQRFKCKFCGHAYTFHNRKNKTHNEKSWFKLWVVEGYSLRQLADISKHGIKKIKRIKSYWLKQEPPSTAFTKKPKYLLFDGTYFKHENCLMLAMDNANNNIVAHRYHYRENFATSLGLFNELSDQQIKPTAITIDGNTSVIRAIKAAWPGVIIQRCLAHVQRQGLAWLRRYPKLQAGKELRELLLTVTGIKDDRQKQIFIDTFMRWEERHGEFVRALPTADKVFSDLQRTRSLIIHALPDMFHYLDDFRIAATTNKVEGYFSRMKNIYRQHRGLSKLHRHNYFKWYIHLKNNLT